MADDLMPASEGSTPATPQGSAPEPRPTRNMARRNSRLDRQVYFGVADNRRSFVTRVHLRAPVVVAVAVAALVGGGAFLARRGGGGPKAPNVTAVVKANPDVQRGKENLLEIDVTNHGTKPVGDAHVLLVGSVTQRGLRRADDIHVAFQDVNYLGSSKAGAPPVQITRDNEFELGPIAAGATAHFAMPYTAKSAGYGVAGPDGMVGFWVKVSDALLDKSSGDKGPATKVGLVQERLQEPDKPPAPGSPGGPPPPPPAPKPPAFELCSPKIFGRGVCVGVG